MFILTDGTGLGTVLGGGGRYSPSPISRSARAYPRTAPGGSSLRSAKTAPSSRFALGSVDERQCCASPICCALRMKARPQPSLCYTCATQLGLFRKKHILCNTNSVACNPRHTGYRDALEVHGPLCFCRTSLTSTLQSVIHFCRYLEVLV